MVPIVETTYAEQVCEICRGKTIYDPLNPHRRICVELQNHDPKDWPHSQIYDRGDVHFIDEMPFTRDVYEQMFGRDSDGHFEED